MRANYRGLSVALLLSLATMARGADPSVPVMHMSAASFDAVQKLITDLQIPLPNLKEALEGQLPFLGGGTVDGAKPVGGILYCNDDVAVSSGQSMVMAIPVLAGKATADSPGFVGSKPGDQPNIFSMATLNFRRTDNYLLFENVNSNGLSAFTETMLTDDYKKAGLLATMSFDLKALRAAAPVSYKAFLDQAHAQDKHSENPATAAGEKIGEEMVYHFIDTLETGSISISQSGDNLHVTAGLAPFEAPAVQPLPKPIFPDNVLFQVHVVYPNAQWAHWAENFVDALPDTLGTMTADQFARDKDLAKRVMRMGFSGKGFSAAVAMKDGKPTGFFVVQMSDDLNVAAEIKDLVAKGTAIEKEVNPNTRESMEVSSYVDGAATVTRLMDTDGAGTSFYIDSVQNGRLAYFTISDNKDGHYVEKLAQLGMKGTTDTFCAGTINLDSVADVIPDDGSKQTQMAKAVLAGQSVGFTVETGQPGKTVALDIAVPLSLLRDFVKVAMGGVTPG